MPRKPAKRTRALTVVRTQEATGVSASGWQEAVLDAVAGSGLTKTRLVGFEVSKLAGDLRRSRIARYRATVRIAYREESTGPER